MPPSPPFTGTKTTIESETSQNLLPPLEEPWWEESDKPADNERKARASLSVIQTGVINMW